MKLIGMMCEPAGALTIGAFAGVLSVLGYKYLSVRYFLNFSEI